MTIPNQIGLEGDVTPPQYMGQIPSSEEVPQLYYHKYILRWRWLRVARHYNYHFNEPETVIEIKLPRKVSNLVRSYVIAFGRVHTNLVTGSWHMRGGPSIWNIVNL